MDVFSNLISYFRQGRRGSYFREQVNTTVSRVLICQILKVEEGFYTQGKHGKAACYK